MKRQHIVECNGLSTQPALAMVERAAAVLGAPCQPAVTMAIRACLTLLQRSRAQKVAPTRGPSDAQLQTQADATLPMIVLPEQPQPLPWLPVALDTAKVCTARGFVNVTCKLYVRQNTNTSSTQRRLNAKRNVIEE